MIGGDSESPENHHQEDCRKFRAMQVSSFYVCPSRGLDQLDTPDPARLTKAAGAARSLGVGNLVIPVLEEFLLGPTEKTVRRLDGLAAALDRIQDSGLSARLLAPAQHVLGLDWIPPYMAAPGPLDEALPVFTAGKVRRLGPFPWWKDPLLIQKRIRLFRELATAVAGHPAIHGWVLLDRVLDWSRPDPAAADFYLKACIGEIRERDSSARIELSLNHRLLAEPAYVIPLAKQADGVFIRCPDEDETALPEINSLAARLNRAAFLGAVSQWLLDRPSAVETGPAVTETSRDRDSAMQAAARLSRQGPEAVVWPSLADPDPVLKEHPPWGLSKSLAKAGMLDPGHEPKPGLEGLLGEMTASASDHPSLDFLDISVQEYLAEPGMHLRRLWGHFRDTQ